MAIGARVDKVVVGQLEALGQQRLGDVGALLGRDEDEVGVVGGDEEDGDASQGQWRRQLHNTAGGIESGADYREDHVRVFRDGDGLGSLARQRLQDGLKHILGPGGVADKRALYGSDANVEEAMLSVGSEPLKLKLGRVAGAGDALGLGEEDSEDWLEEGRIEVERDVDQRIGAILNRANVRLGRMTWRKLIDSI